MRLGFPGQFALVCCVLVTTASSNVSELVGQNVLPGVDRSLTPFQADDLVLINDVEDDFVSLFNGRTLDGWVQKNGTATYEVVDGTILGRTAVGSPNSFLCTVKEYSDFELKFEVKVDKGLNSGVQIRSLSKPGFRDGRVHGPQIEIESDPGESGYIYSEGTGRKWISPTQTRRNVFKNDGWNHYRVIADGRRIQTWVNGTQIEDVETAEVESLKGFIGLQVHGIGKRKDSFKVQWRNIRIKELLGTETRTIKAFQGTPVVDGKIDDIWNNVPRLKTTREVKEHNELAANQQPSTAWVRCLWDDGHLYCLAEVTDSNISVSGFADWNKDSVEFFVDGNLSQATSYDKDDAQYRTSADGKLSSGPTSDIRNYQSAVSKTENGYLVESRIKLETGNGKTIGFDVQVNNDPGDGRRKSTMKWNDASNNSWEDLSAAGILEMVGDKK